MSPGWLAIAGWVLSLVVISTVFFLSHRARLKLAGGKPWPGPWPHTALIIPVKGLSPTLERDLKTFIDQDHPRFEIIFTAQDEQDPAWPLLGQLADNHGHVRLAAAGRATRNGQKNHNLLAGLAKVDRQSQILAFSDAGHQAPADWLRKLAAPLAGGEAVVSSGFHQIIPQRPGLALLGRAACVLWMFWGRHVPLMMYPWGGATAITREAFDQLGVAELWADTVVDDVTLGRRMRESGLRMVPCPAATLDTASGDNGWSSWLAWLERQLIYIKFIEPASWALLGLAALVFLCLTLYAMVITAGLVFGAAPAWMGFSALAFLVLLVAVAHVPRASHPAPGPLWAWMPASFAAIVLVVSAFICNLFTNKVRWGGIDYQTGYLGRVKAIRRSED